MFFVRRNWTIGSLNPVNHPTYRALLKFIGHVQDFLVKQYRSSTLEHMIQHPLLKCQNGQKAPYNDIEYYCTCFFSTVKYFKFHVLQNMACFALLLKITKVFHRTLFEILYFIIQNTQCHALNLNLLSELCISFSQQNILFTISKHVSCDLDTARTAKKHCVNFTMR